MIRRAMACALCIALAAAGGGAEEPRGLERQVIPGVARPVRAWENYLLNCQGCHTPSGKTNAHAAPSLAGHVALFTQLPGGRAYLGRVPGIATAPLSNADLAELLNWMLWRFDKGHIAKDFRPYDGDEVSRLRRLPLRTDAPTVRASILAGGSGAALPK